MKHKFDGIETASMFDVPDPEIRNAPVSSRRAFPGPRTIRRVLCAYGEHTAALIIGNGEHLIWRGHLTHTVGGSAWWCRAGGKCLCEAPAPVVAGVHTPTCADPTSGEWSW